VRRNWVPATNVIAGVGKLSANAFENGDDMRRLTGIVSDQRPGLVGQRAYDSDLFDPRLEGKQTVVLEQDHGLIREFACVRAMFSAVKFLLIDPVYKEPCPAGRTCRA
jgi:hypothetical protein